MSCEICVVLTVSELRSVRRAVAASRLETGPSEQARHLRWLDDAIRETEQYGDRGYLRPDDKRMPFGPERSSGRGVLRRFRDFVMAMEPTPDEDDRQRFLADLEFIDELIIRADTAELGGRP